MLRFQRKSEKIRSISSVLLLAEGRRPQQTKETIDAGWLTDLVTDLATELMSMMTGQNSRCCRGSSSSSSSRSISGGTRSHTRARGRGRTRARVGERADTGGAARHHCVNRSKRSWSIEVRLYRGAKCTKKNCMYVHSGVSPACIRGWNLF